MVTTTKATAGASPQRAADGATEAAALLPFKGKHRQIGGLKLHYLDEGRGEPLVMLHGNPTWCYYYRDLVAAFRDRYRCIVPDHIGMGLSEKPGDDRYDYTLARRADDLAALLDGLSVRESITLVVHDWGGMIGMAYATRHPGRIKRLIVLNTAAFHLPRGKRFPTSLALARTAPGGLLIRALNLFVKVAARRCVTKEPLAPDVQRAYLAPYDSWANRIAVLRFVQDIPLRPGDRAYQLVSEVDAKLEQLRGLPMLICWGERDFIFDVDFLAEWQRRFPDAQVRRFPEAGHYVLEDEGPAIVQEMEAFLAQNPLTPEETGS